MSYRRDLSITTISISHDGNVWPVLALLKTTVKAKVILMEHQKEKDNMVGREVYTEVFV